MSNAQQGGSQWPWYICGALLLATFLNYMDRQALPQTATDLKELYQLSDSRYGMIEGCFAWAFALGSIVFGIFADRYGPRWIYPLVLTGWSIAGLLTPLAGNDSFTQMLVMEGDTPGTGLYRWLLICRTMLGLFEAGHWPCALITVKKILTDKNRPLGNAILQSGASLGAILIPQYVIWVRMLGGSWETVFTSIGIVGLLWVPLWIILVWNVDLKGEKGSSFIQNILDIRKDFSPQLIHRLICLLVVVTCLTISWQFLRAWLPKYLRESAGYTEERSATIIMGYYISADIGCILVGVLVRTLIARGRSVHASRILAYFFYACLTGCAALVPVVSPDVAVVCLLLAGAGILGLHPLYYALVQELPSRSVGTLSGLLAAVGWFIVGFIQTTIGKQIEEQGYGLGFSLAGLVPAIGLFALLIFWKKSDSA